MSQPLNKFSSRITQPKSQGASQAMLYATGMTEADMQKPQVGIASVWYEGNSCNMHLNDLAAKVKEGVVKAGLVGMRFNTIGVSDGISMGTEGMSYSLQSRDLIADSIETVMHAQWYDANISIPGCDKNMPGCLIAMGRINRPALMVYGGTIKPGHSHGDTLDIVSAFQCYGEFLSGKMDDSTRQNVVRHACPGAGACGGMYTANTMATAIETMGMSLPYSSSTPAEDPGKLEECLRAGEAIRVCLERDLKPRDIMTRKAFVVFKRGNSNWQGHVAFFLKKAGGRVLVRGGNQGNAVSDAWYSEANVLGYRWPAGVAQPTNGSASFPDYVAHARLMLGSYSEEVAVWQRGLNALGQRPALKVDKDFGPATRGATITFQKKRQLPPDAVVDGPDWIALETLIEALG